MLTAAVLGPLAYGIGAAGWLMASGNPFWRRDMLALPTVVASLASFGIPSLIVGLPLYAPLLLLWALIARRWARLDSAGGVFAGTVSLAALGALLLFVAAARDSRPLAPHGFAALSDALQWGGLVWLALVLPRLLIPRLRPGAFAATRGYTDRRSLRLTREVAPPSGQRSADR